MLRPHVREILCDEVVHLGKSGDLNLEVCRGRIYRELAAAPIAARSGDKVI
jgi:hypothetical protein